MRLLGCLRTGPADPTTLRASHFAGLASITLAALGLRLLRLDFQPLWWDEGWSLYFSSTSLADLLHATAVDIHPPFYYLLLKLWTALFGVSPVAVRLLSVFIGTASVPLFYLAGRRLLGNRGGLLAASLLAISPFHVYYSQEVRMYGLVTLLGLAAYWFALKLAGPGWRSIAWLGYVLAATAALYTQYYAGFLLLALNLAYLTLWLRNRRPIRDAIPWLTAQLAVLVLFLPWVWFAAGKLATYVRFKVGVEEDLPLGLPAYLGRHLAAFGWGHAEGLLADWWWLGLLPLLLLAAAALVMLRKRTKDAGAREHSVSAPHASVIDRHGPWIILVALLASGFAVNRVLPFNPPRLERLLLLGLPFYLLLLAFTLMFLWKLRRLAAILPAVTLVVFCLVSLGVLFVVPRYPDDDYRPLAAEVRALALPSDAIVCIHPWQVGYLQAYLPPDERPTLYLTPREVLPRERQLWAEEPERMAADLETLLAEHRRLWVPAHQVMGRVLEGQIETYLVGASYPVRAEWFGESTVLSLYANGEPQDTKLSAQFGDWLSLEGAALNPEPLEAGWGVVTTDLTWQVMERPDERYQVGLRLVDDSDRIWAQRDSKPLGGTHQFYEWSAGLPRLDRHGLLVPAGTPPGEYRVTLRVYRSYDVAVLPVSSSGGGGNELSLGTVRVVRPQVSPPVEALTYSGGQTLETALRTDFGRWLRLLGFTLGEATALLPGETVQVDLFWQALVSPGEDLLPRLQLLGDADQIVAERTEKPVVGSFPTAWWQAGDLVRDPHSLPILAAVAPGTYRLGLSLVRAADGSLVEIGRGRTLVELAQIDVEGRSHEYWPPFTSHPLQVSFGSGVELVGYELREVARAPGSPLEITLHWHTLGTPERNYWAFAHLLRGEGEQAQIVAQHDGIPGDGRLPTLGWLPGEYLSDTHLLQLPFDLPDGTYYVGVGLYDPDANQRLGDRALLDTTVTVKRIGGCMCR